MSSWHITDPKRNDILWKVCVQNLWWKKLISLKYSIHWVFETVCLWLIGSGLTLGWNKGLYWKFISDGEQTIWRTDGDIRYWGVKWKLLRKFWKYESQINTFPCTWSSTSQKLQVNRWNASLLIRKRVWWFIDDSENSKQKSGAVSMSFIIIQV